MIRATPARRSSSAVGSGDWWNEVSTTASSMRRPATRGDEPFEVGLASTGGGSASTQGRAQVSTSSTPGSSRAAAGLRARTAS